MDERFESNLSRLHPSLEGKVRIEPVTIGGKSGQELLRQLGRKHVDIDSYAKSMAESAEFTTLPQPEARDLVIGKVGDLVPNPGVPYATTKKIWARRDELGLESLPAETALHYLLQNGDKLQQGEVIWMSMKTIFDRYGDPRVFGVGRGYYGLWLFSHWTTSYAWWDPGHRFAFRLPQVNKA